MSIGASKSAKLALGGAGFVRELRETGRLAVALALAQLGQIAIGTTDVLMVGRLGKAPLAAIGLGWGFYLFFLLFGIGVLIAVSALAAQAYGAGQPRTLRRTVRQGLWLAVLLSAPILVILSQAERIFLALGQDAELAASAGAYVDTVMWALPPALWYMSLRGFMSALGRPRPILWTMLAGVALNGFLDFALIFGEFGAPRLEATGAAIATVIAYFTMFALALAVSVWAQPYRRYHIIHRFWRADWKKLAEIWVVGLPIGIAVAMEIGLFVGAIILMGLISTTSVAAHQIAVQSASVAFMIPLGISQAATVRVGQALGRGDRHGVTEAAWAAFGLGGALMVLTAALFLLAPHAIVGLYIDTSDPGNGNVVTLAASFLVVAGLFQVFDGAQVIAAGALRGLGDTRAPMYVAAFSFWGVGFPSCLILGFAAGLGGLGIWIGLLIGLTVAAVLLWVRFQRRERLAALMKLGRAP